MNFSPVIYVDHEIPFGADAFSRIGKVFLFDSKEVMSDPSLLFYAQVLVFRSTTKIDQRLLAHTPNLIALASPTIGVDHINFRDLENYRRAYNRDVPFFYAPGSTAGGVADWSIQAILEIGYALEIPLEKMIVGIWGFGACGSQLGKRLDLMGISYRHYDPPLMERSHAQFSSCSLDEVLDCDVISIHVPLTMEGKWKTFHMINGDIFEKMKGKVKAVINTSRGGVIEQDALKNAMSEGLVACLDVWEREPTPDLTLVKNALLSTPHVAGSVFEGKARATEMVFYQVAQFFNLSSIWLTLLDRSKRLKISGGSARKDINLVRRMIGIDKVSEHFKHEYIHASEGERGEVFRRIRRQSMRHELEWVE